MLECDCDVAHPCSMGGSNGVGIEALSERRIRSEGVSEPCQVAVGQRLLHRGREPHRLVQENSLRSRHPRSGSGTNEPQQAREALLAVAARSHMKTKGQTAPVLSHGAPY